MPDEMHMQRRGNEKDAAIAKIARVLNELGEQRRNPDHWERVCLVRALSEVFSGCYSLALTDAHHALTPLDERSPFAKLPNDPLFDRCDLGLLWRALHEAKGEPVREFPHLGPIIVTGRALP
jgi:hypothetical protein